MTRLALTLISAMAVAAATGSTQAAADTGPKVVASIKPVHSLAAAVMEGVGEPALIVEGAGSPHTYALKPSQARNLAEAELVFWIGPELESFFIKPVESIASQAKSVTLVDAPGVVRLPLREGGAFDSHDHGDHAEHAHDDHAHDDHAHDDHAEHDHAEHEEHAKHDDDHAEHDHAKHDDHADHDEHAKHDEHDHAEHSEHAEHHEEEHAHAHGAFDSHVWLDPQNAKAMAQAIAEALSAADPDNAATYQSNAEALKARLDALTTEVDATLAPVRGKPFIVFHDAYQSFEKRFGLAAAGSITVSPEVMPGAARIAEMQAKVKTIGAACVFAEPQFEPKLVSVVIEDSRAKSGVLDPLGAGLDDGPELYPALIRAMAASFRDCLAASS